MKQGFIKTPNTSLSRQQGVCFVSARFSTLHLFKCPKMKDTSKFSVKKNHVILWYLACQNKTSFLFLTVKILKITLLQVIDIVKA